MRDPARIRAVCDALEETWSEHPDMRLGQFLECFIFPTKIIGESDVRCVCLPFWQEDDVTLQKLMSMKRAI